MRLRPVEAGALCGHRFFFLLLRPNPHFPTRTRHTMTLLSTASFAPARTTGLRSLFAAALLTAAGWSQALELKPFSAEALAAAQQAGQPVAVHFHAEWCPTCKLQEKSLHQLKAESGLDMTVLVADYDKEKELKKAMRVRSQSTLVVFRGTQEKARLGGDTAADKIRAALKTAL